MVTVGCDVADSGAAIAAARSHAGVWATAGVHPHDAVRRRRRARRPAGRARGGGGRASAGSTTTTTTRPGPSSGRCSPPRSAWPTPHDLALVIHTREAWDDTFAVLAAEGVPERTVFHCFTGGPDEARRCLDLGAYLSFSGIVTFKARRRRCGPPPRSARSTACWSRPTRPYLAPGAPPGRAQPAGVGAAGGRGRGRGEGVPVDAVVAEATWANAARLYRLPDSPGDADPPRGHRAARPPRAVARAGPSGQNFVVDPNTVRRIARLAGVGPGDQVVEIGAGLGSLTLALAETGRVGDRGRGRPPPRCRCCAEVVEPAGAARRRGRRHDPRLGRGARRVDGTWVLVANLPYNVATPLVLDLLDGVPAIERMLVMVQREVGERLAAGAGDAGLRHPVGEGGLLGHGRGRRPGAGADVFLPQPRVESALVRDRAAARRRPSTADPEPALRAGAGRLRPAPQDAAPVAGRPGRRRGVRRRRRPPRGPGRGARRRGLGPAGRRACALRGWPVGDGRRDVLGPPAKLTLSLRVTGVRADGYHLLDAEMVTLDLADELAFDRRRRPRGRRAGDGGRRARRRRQPRAPGAGGRRAHAPTSGSQAHPRRRRARRRLGRRRRRAALGRRATTSTWRPRSAPTCRSASSAAGPGCGASARSSSRCRRRRAPSPCSRRRSAARPPAVYRAWDELGGPTGDGPERPRAGRAGGRARLAEWRDRLGDATGATPVLAGSGSHVVRRGRVPRGPGRIVVRTATPPAIGRERGYLPGAALPARALQQLLVLLLAHALAALLDQRAHGGGQR